MLRVRRSLPTFLRALTSLELTIALLVLLMILVAACTLAQVRLGTYEAVRIYFRSAFLYWRPPGSYWRLPVFPAGGAAGAALLANLVASHACRFEWSWRKAGLWVVHAGLILLFMGEFSTGFFAVESQMPIDQGSVKSYSESPREAELAVIDATDPRWDEVCSVSEPVLARKARIETRRLPFALLVKKYYANAEIVANPQLPASGRGNPAPGLPSLANMGAGPGLLVFERPAVTADDQIDVPAVFVELVNGDRSLGTWLVSPAIQEPQGFEYAGRSYRLALRPKRYYFPFSIALKKFTHDVYPGTDIPSNFSSLIHLSDPARGEDRDVLIYMNHPLRYGGKTFYQASFAKNDTQSIFQVVRNPGWLLPYISCSLVGLGLLFHFGARLLGAAKSIGRAQ